MYDIKNLCGDGFTIPDLGRDMDSIAFLSLKVALKSYFSTYKAMAYYGSQLFEDKLESKSYSSEYIEQYTETIIHFQHFFELICKDILREKNELLVLNIDNNNELLYKLVQGEEVQSEELVNIKTIEFDRTFNRLCDLISKGKFSDYAFFNEKKTKEALKQLNIMRNRIWHRGIYVMKYKDLDLFIVKYILPIVKEIISLDKYSKVSRFWIYRQKELRVDPLDEIIKICSNSDEQPSIDHLAFLKEIGRAAYHNPHSHGFGLIRSDIADRSKRIAINEIPHEDKEDYLINCPVCGTDSLVKNLEYGDERDEYGQVTSGWTWIDNIKCYCCSFELQSSGMKNPNEYGYALPDFWQKEEY
ncbi:hypothetical protein [Lysinibacillus sphaericus]|uniref:hypothetical protein n=1 Tax=Lysinibacillus sphaericus TaxID=1421 RepID=UPI001911241D|nr:hypothetical protein [Lysinibacillus sphaericus]QPA56120.1 hypothetical protein INQ53_09055 [Lysinibacillus sphaericus]